jgi:hypothetical protein
MRSMLRAKAADLLNIHRTILIALVVLAIAVRLFFWIYTNRTWEDALISVQHSENAAAGLGLTHTPSDGPPLHGFTSPLSVLVPLVGDLIHIGFGLPLMKLVSALLGGVAVFLGFEICIYLQLPPALALTAAAYLAFEHHQILWGIAGMETQITIVAYLYSIWCLQRRSQLEKGISLGLCLLARPDAVVWVGIACAFELWRAFETRDLKPLGILAAGLLLIYGPWLIFTFAYYGSPIPNTIYAKSLGYRGLLLGRRPRSWMTESTILAAAHNSLNPFSTLGTVYGGNGVGFQTLWDRHGIVARVMAFLSVPGLIAAFRGRDKNALMIYSFIAAYLAYFVLLVPAMWGWYTPPFTAVAVVGSVYGLWSLMRLIPAPKLRPAVASAFGVAYVTLIVIAMPVTMRAEKHVQQYVEIENREAVGLYVKSLAKSGDTIGCEPLGYIGYYSRLPIYDYPGLCNRKVVQYLREHPRRERTFALMLQYFHPTFLVLRPWESKTGDQVTLPWISQDYSLIRVFRVPPEKSSQLLYAGSNVDLEFDVFELKSAQSATIGTEP